MKSTWILTACAASLMAAAGIAYAQFAGAGGGTPPTGALQLQSPIVIQAPRTPSSPLVVAQVKPTDNADSNPFAADPFGGGAFGQPRPRTGAGRMRPHAGSTGKAAGSRGGKDEKLAASWVGHASARIHEIESKLTQSTNIDFIETPLDDVASYLSELHEVPVIVKTRALDDLGVTTDAPVTCTAQNISLASALNLTLKQVDLTYTIEDEVLQITTPEDAEANMLIRVYWLQQTTLSADDATELVETLVDPEAWDAVGGPGSIRGIEAADKQSCGIAVAAAYTTHRKIEALLKAVSQLTGDLRLSSPARGAGGFGAFGGGEMGMEAMEAFGMEQGAKPVPSSDRQPQAGDKQDAGESSSGERKKKRRKQRKASDAS